MFFSLSLFINACSYMHPRIGCFLGRGMKGTIASRPLPYDNYYALHPCMVCCIGYLFVIMRVKLMLPCVLYLPNSLSYFKHERSIFTPSRSAVLAHALLFLGAHAAGQPCLPLRRPFVISSARGSYARAQQLSRIREWSRGLLRASYLDYCYSGGAPQSPKQCVQ